MTTSNDNVATASTSSFENITDIVEALELILHRNMSFQELISENPYLSDLLETQNVTIHSMLRNLRLTQVSHMSPSQIIDSVTQNPDGLFSQVLGKITHIKYVTPGPDMDYLLLAGTSFQEAHPVLQKACTEYGAVFTVSCEGYPHGITIT